MNIGLLLKGAAMGIAEAIPGVSGGTIAFITGIYEELLRTIKSFTPSALKQLYKSPSNFWTTINGPFLLWLLLGMVSGIIAGVFGISHLLENHQILLWSFFFGLVLASAFYFALDLKWTWYHILFALAGATLAFFVTKFLPAQGSEHPLYLILSGVLAISALMLPGLSGSFLLLLLGLYEVIIGGVKGILSGDISRLPTVAYFSLGALIGLFSFARVLSFLFRKYPSSTMAAMIGILIGSLAKLWPWKIITGIIDKATGQYVVANRVEIIDDNLYKVATEVNVAPSQYQEFADPRVALCLVCIASGILVVFLLAKYGPAKTK